MRRDSAYFQDIIMAADRISRFIAGMTEQEFLTDEKTQSAVVREILLIGEKLTTNRITAKHHFTARRTFGPRPSSQGIQFLVHRTPTGSIHSHPR